VAGSLAIGAKLLFTLVYDASRRSGRSWETVIKMMKLALGRMKMGLGKRER